MSEDKKKFKKGNKNKERGVSPSIAPDSGVVARKLDGDLASTESNGAMWDDATERLTNSAGDSGAQSPTMPQSPMPFEHDWTNGSLTWAPNHERFATDSAYANHLSYPASCSNPARREMYYNCLTTDLKMWTKQMWSIAHLVDEQLIGVKRIDHAFSGDDSEIIDLSMPVGHAVETVLSGNKRPISSIDPNTSFQAQQVMRTINKTQPLLAGDTPVNVDTIAHFSRGLQEYEQGGLLLDRALCIGAQQKQTINTVFRLANVEENIRLNWQDPSIVPTSLFVNALTKAVSGYSINLSGQETFRLDLLRQPISINMFDPMSTVNQISYWTDRYQLYGPAVSNTLTNDQERKNQLSNLEKTMRLIGEGPEAKQEITAFFNQLKADKCTFPQAIERLGALHWELHDKATTVKKWFDLSRFSSGNANKRAHETNKDMPPPKQPSSAHNTQKQPANTPAPAGGAHQELGWQPITDPAMIPRKWHHPEEFSDLCQICNRPHLQKGPCKFNDPIKFAGLANFEGGRWKDSKVGKEFHKLGYYAAMEKHPKFHLDLVSKGHIMTFPGKISCSMCQTSSELNLDEEDPFPIALTPVSVRSQDKQTQEMITALLDTGSGASFMRPALAKKLKLKFHNISTLSCFKNQLSVCGALDGPCTRLANYVIADIKISNHSTARTSTACYKSEQTIRILCFISDVKHDLIIGLRDIRRHNLVLAVPNLFCLPSTTNAVVTNKPAQSTQAGEFPHELVANGILDAELKHGKDASTTPSSHFLCRDSRCGCGMLDHKKTARNRKNPPATNTTWQREPALPLSAEFETTMDDSVLPANVYQSVSEPPIPYREPGQWIKLYQLSVDNSDLLPEAEDRIRLESSFNSNYARHAFLREDIWEIPDEMLESYPACFLDSQTNSSADFPTNISGSPELQSAIKSLVAEYHDIFSRNLSKEAAKVTPFSFEVNEKEWRHRRNQSRVRKYDSSKTKIIAEYVEKLFAAGVITTSTADHYSHGFVVPKSTEGQWRFVVDFKNLNKVSSAEHWPIPNIATLLRRIGDKGATIFNVMDLTSGYFQAPIAESVQKYTSFMTDSGCYKWTRLPMGPKGAGSYFQRTMTQEVFNGFIKIFAELYLDDLLVYALTEEECITNLRKIFNGVENSI